MNDKLLLTILILWFIFLFIYKKFVNSIELFRMKIYNGKGFNLIPLEDQNQVIYHYSHSIIPKYPPNTNHYPLIKK